MKKSNLKTWEVHKSYCNPPRCVEQHIITMGWSIIALSATLFSQLRANFSLESKLEHLTLGANWVESQPCIGSCPDFEQIESSLWDWADLGLGQCAHYYPDSLEEFKGARLQQTASIPTQMCLFKIEFLLGLYTRVGVLDKGCQV